MEPVSPDPEAAEREVAHASTVRRLWSALGPFLVLIGLVALLALVVGDSYFSATNARNILVQTIIIAVGAIGMTLIIVSGGIDISCGSTVALAGMCSAWALKQGAWPSAAVAAAVAAGAAVGCLNGGIIAWLRIPPFVTTLGMLGVARGLAKAVGRELDINYDAASWIDRLMRPTPRATDPWWQQALLVAPGAWIAALLAVAATVLMRRTVFGRQLHAIGSNEAAARLCGVRVEWTKLAVYGVAGACFGCAGLLMMAKLHQGSTTTAVGLELDVIAAVVIGGASLTGGVGTVTGSLVGALVIAVLRNGTQQLPWPWSTQAGWPNYMQEILIGAVIVAAAGVDRLRMGRRG